MNHLCITNSMTDFHELNDSCLYQSNWGVHATALHITISMNHLCITNSMSYLSRTQWLISIPQQIFYKHLRRHYKSPPPYVISISRTPWDISHELNKSCLDWFEWVTSSCKRTRNHRLNESYLYHELHESSLTNSMTHVYIRTNAIQVYAKALQITTSIRYLYITN